MMEALTHQLHTHPPSSARPFVEFFWFVCIFRDEEKASVKEILSKRREQVRKRMTIFAVFFFSRFFISELRRFHNIIQVLPFFTSPTTVVAVDDSPRCLFLFPSSDFAHFRLWISSLFACFAPFVGNSF
jgi:hypothetical protein